MHENARISVLIMFHRTLCRLLRDFSLKEKKFHLKKIEFSIQKNLNLKIAIFLYNLSFEVFLISSFEPFNRKTPFFASIQFEMDFQFKFSSKSGFTDFKMASKLSH